MKSVLAVLIFTMLWVLSACDATPPARPILIESGTASSATLPAVVTETSSNDIFTASEVSMQDSGRTLTMKVGVDFLLKLDTDFYDWTVEVDNPSLLSRKLNVTVVKGALGIYQALEAGTTTLNASGNPKCLNTRPACLAPSVTFTLTVVVQ